MTTGESLLVSEQATALGNELYKPSARSELVSWSELRSKKRCVSAGRIKDQLESGHRQVVTYAAGGANATPGFRKKYIT